MYTTQDNRFSSFLELPGKPIGAGCIGGHETDPDKIAVLLEIDAFGFFIDRNNLVLFGCQAPEDDQCQLRHHHLLVGLLGRVNRRGYEQDLHPFSLF
jgi:hypothetical protein